MKQNIEISRKLTRSSTSINGDRTEYSEIVREHVLAQQIKKWPGMFIHKAINGKGWTCTQGASGLSVGPPWHTKKALRDCMNHLSDSLTEQQKTRIAAIAPKECEASPLMQAFGRFIMHARRVCLNTPLESMVGQFWRDRADMAEKLEELKAAWL